MFIATRSMANESPLVDGLPHLVQGVTDHAQPAHRSAHANRRRR